jgi:poly(3-hydroxybutyrate) depolymerase
MLSTTRRGQAGQHRQHDQMHEIADKDGFCCLPGGDQRGAGIRIWCRSSDDVSYLAALIAYMKSAYAVDETRVYIGGFSNGSAMSQVFAMTNPELIAAVIADNTRFCQNRNTKPFAIAGCKKLQYDYRMPVFYTYGTRDIEYPAVRGSGQRADMIT